MSTIQAHTVKAFMQHYKKKKKKKQNNGISKRNYYIVLQQNINLSLIQNHLFRHSNLEATDELDKSNDL